MRITFFWLLLLLSPGIIVKAQKRCNIISSSTIGGNRSDVIARQITRTSDGGFIVLIKSNSTTGNFNLNCTSVSPNSEHLFRKYDSTGTNIIWERCYSDSNFVNTGFSIYYLFPHQNGQFTVIGNGPGGLATDGIVVRGETSNGTVVWQKGYGGTGSLELQAVLPTSDGGWIMAAESYVSDGDVGSHYGSIMSPDIWIIKVDSNGNKVWTRNIGGSNYDNVRALVPAPNGGCYVAGFTRSDDYDCTGLNNPSSTNLADAYVMRLDSSGNKIWHRCLGGSNGEGAYDACSDGAGGLVMAGSTYSSDGYVHGYKGNGEIFWVLGVDSNGSVSWDNCYGSPDPNASESPNVICRGKDGSYWIAGTCNNTKGGEVDTAFSAPHSSAWVVHIGRAGQFINSRVLGNAYDSRADMLMPVTSNNVVIAGYFLGPGGTLPGTFYSPGGSETDIFFTRLSPVSLGVNNVESSAGRFEVYPNPAKTEFSVKISSNTSGNIKVIDVLGRVIKDDIHIAPAETVKIDCQELRSGTYFIMYSIPDGLRMLSKIQLL